MSEPTEVKILNKWNKFGPGVPEVVEVHLRGVIHDNQYFIELRDYYPDRDHYGDGYLVAHGGRVNPQEEAESIGDLISVLKGFTR